jgi:hypothetical protein
MFTSSKLPALVRNRFVWVAVILLAVSATTVALLNAGPSAGQPDDVRGQLATRMKTVLEQLPPSEHQGHGGHASQSPEPVAKVVCAVRVYGFEPETATTVAAVDTVYGYHLCGVAEQGRPWDWAVKLVGPLVMGMSTEPPTVQVAESTATATFPERVRQVFPEKYQQLALQESLGEEPMRELRRRYDKAAGL